VESEHCFLSFGQVWESALHQRISIAATFFSLLAQEQKLQKSEYKSNPQLIELQSGLVG